MAGFCNRHKTNLLFNDFPSIHVIITPFLLWQESIKQGQVVLDQIRTIDKKRLIKKIGAIDSKVQLNVISILQKLSAF
ncbi:type II toxin-antitoxin system PemK/MazF family toxin [Desulfosarcina variabilis]|uniref:type II toxin-antitoxin system PemK/MazF family toxin n=1 Tax=Desulfosarcina variabilis TaxID=2300 RepID=UPI003AFAAEE1